MRNKASLLLLAVFLAGCGGGAEKAAFESYESAVNPSLEAEADLRRKFDEKVDDIRAFGNEAAFVELRVKKLLPFYTEMAVNMKAVQPEGGTLSEIHAQLVRYADLWLLVLADYGTLEEKKLAAEKASRPVISKLMEAEKGLGTRIAGLNEALNSEPLSIQAFGPLLREDPGQAADTALNQLKQGAVRPPSAYGGLVDSRLIPAYEQLKRSVAAAEQAQKFPDVLKACIGYFDARLHLLRESKGLAVVQAGLMDELGPLTERLGDRMDEAMNTLEAYKTAAKAYRDSMR